jgi:hypothetical protein
MLVSFSGGVAALNHRLMAVTPPGSPVSMNKTWLF